MIYTVQLIRETEDETECLHEFPQVFRDFESAAKFSKLIIHNTRIAAYDIEGYYTCHHE